jgi:adenylate cyclase
MAQEQTESKQSQRAGSEGALTEGRVERRLAAILAADVAGYSRLMGQDEAGTLARLRTHRRELIDPKVVEHKGRIVKITGDGLLIEFPSVVEAVTCAVAVQRGMAERNTPVPEDQRIVFRVGINLGDIIVEADGSRPYRRQARPYFDDLGERQLKNIARPVRVFRVGPGNSEPAPIAVHESADRAEPLALPHKPRLPCCRSKT